MIPTHGTFDGCEDDANGLCSLDTLLADLRKRLESIDYAALCLKKSS